VPRNPCGTNFAEDPMPFNGSNRIEALFAFVDQYVAGDPAMRSGFDQVFGDVVTSVNAAIAYLEGLTATGTDQRYLGRVVAVPTERNDTTPLEAGDFYVAGHVDAGRVGLTYVYNGSAFVVASDFTSIGSFFKDTLSAAGTPAVARSALELGSAATQNATAFAAASVATDVALAIKLLADGIAKSMTSNDWDNAHLAGPGTTMVQANAAALNAPVALNAAGIYVAYDASNGFVLAVAHSTGQVYYRMRVAATWGTWREIATANLTAAEGDILYRAASAWARLAKGTARQILMMKADASALEYVSVSAPILLATKTASGSASLIFTETDATKFRDYKFRLRGVKPATSGVLQLEVSANGGASWSPSNYQNLIETNVAGGVAVELDQVIAALWSMTGTTTSVSNAANAHGVFGDVMIYEAGATRRTRFNIEHLGYDAPNVTTVVGSGTTNDPVAHNAFRWTYSSGNIASGEIEMFGVP
jgi:hypothetical protein